MAEPNSFFRIYRNYLIAAVVVVVALGIYFSQKNNNKTPGDDQTNTQNSQNQDNQNSTNSDQSTTSGSDTTTAASDGSSQNNSGNVTATGTLKNSDNQTRGNYLLDSDKGPIYIRTKRNFTGMVGQQVTLNASGTLHSFVFLGFGPDTTDVGGAAETLPSGNVSFSGTLKDSDNSSLGNYVIVSGSTKVYLKSVHDYSTLVGKDVTLNATGTLASFTGATITQK